MNGEAMNKVPIVGVGAVIIHKDSVLLVKRARPPFLHQWAIPGGKLQWGETLQQAAEREVQEETGITIVANNVVYVFDVIQRQDGKEHHLVVVDLQADYISGEIQVGDDACQAAWFRPNELLSANNIQGTTLAFLKTWWIAGESLIDV